MTTPEEFEASRLRNLWRQFYEIKRLHSELQSLYVTKSGDKKLIKLIWTQIEEREARLQEEGFNYGDHA